MVKRERKTLPSPERIVDDEPYPSFALPLPRHCIEARDSLAALHGYDVVGKAASNTSLEVASNHGQQTVGHGGVRF